MLMGEANIVKQTAYNDSSANTYYKLRQTLFGDLPKKVTYDELSAPDMLSTLNAGSAAWDAVTITEGAGAEINGKFSFPGDNGALLGKNYPFPTVIRQNDLTFGTVQDPHWVNIHYGAWPYDGCYWEKGRDTMDIFADMEAVTDTTPEDGPYAVKTFHLYDKKNELGGATLTAADIKLSREGIVELVGTEFAAVSLAGTDEAGKGVYRYDVPLRALKDGATYRAALFVPDHTLGVLGLGSGAAYDELWRQKPDSAVAAVNGGDHKAAASPQGAEFFLYESVSDEALASLIVDSVTVGGTAGTLAGRKANEAFATYTAGSYTLTLEDAVETDADFAYRAGTLLYTGDGTPPEQAELVVKAHFAVGEGSGAKQEAYTLTVTVESVPTFRVEFLGDEDETVAAEQVSGSMRPMGIHAEAGDLALTLPESRFIRTGYHFAGWKLVAGAAQKDGETAKGGAAGETLIVTPDDNKRVAFAAVWEANRYTVAFDANGGAGAMGRRLANAVDAVRVSGGADISATVHADTDDGLFPADATLACHMTLKHKDAVEGDPVKYPIEGVVTLAGGEGTIYLSTALRDTVVSGTPNTTDEYTGEGEEQRLFRRTEVRKTPLTWTVTLSTNTGGTP